MEFRRRLKRLREQAKMTRYRLSRDAHVDFSHIKRLETGERKNPSRDTVLRICQALLDYSGDITLNDANDLLKDAGYGPVPRNRINILPRDR